MKAYLGIRDPRAALRRAAGAGTLFGIDRERAQFRARARRLSASVTTAATARNDQQRLRKHHERNDHAEAGRRSPASKPSARGARRRPITLKEHIVEIISDSGEGAQRCGQSLGAIAAQHGQRHLDHGDHPGRDPPAGAQRRRRQRQPHPHRLRPHHQRRRRDRPGGGLQRAGAARPRARRRAQARLHHPAGEHVAQPLRPEDRRRPTSRPTTSSWPRATGCTRFRWSRSAARWSRIARRGKNMFALGHAVQHLQPRPEARARPDRARPSARRTRASSTRTSSCSRPATTGRKPTSTSGTASRPCAPTEPQIVVNGNTALALGVLASGMEICAMYPITPATSASHYLSDVFEKVGGMVHQAEDEIAACAFAIGASYAGKCTVTITSGPGYSLKQEAIGLAVMGEIPLVVVNVQRGGPSTGQPTKVEQGDLHDRHLRQPRRRAEGGDGARHHRGLLLFDHHRAQDRRDLQHGGGGAVRRQPRHLAAAVPAPAVQRDLAGAADRPEPGARRAPSPTTGTRPPASRAASSRASPAACTR